MSCWWDESWKNIVLEKTPQFVLAYDETSPLQLLAAYHLAVLRVGVVLLSDLQFDGPCAMAHCIAVHQAGSIRTKSLEARVRAIGAVSTPPPMALPTAQELRAILSEPAGALPDLPEESAPRMAIALLAVARVLRVCSAKGWPYGREFAGFAETFLLHRLLSEMLPLDMRALSDRETPSPPVNGALAAFLDALLSECKAVVASAAAAEDGLLLTRGCVDLFDGRLFHFLVHACRVCGDPLEMLPVGLRESLRRLRDKCFSMANVVLIEEQRVAPTADQSAILSRGAAAALRCDTDQPSLLPFSWRMLSTLVPSYQPITDAEKKDQQRRVEEQT